MRGWTLHASVAAIAVAVAVFTAAGGEAHGQMARTFEDIEIVDASAFGGSSELGYLEHVFRVTNHSSEQTHRVTLTGPVDTYRGGQKITRLRRTVEVAPGSSVRLSILQPPVALGGSNAFRVRINGRVQQDVVNSSAAGGYRPRVPAEAYVLGSPGAMGVPSIREHYRNLKLQFDRHGSDLNQWSRSWLAYTSYAAVAVTADELASAPPEVRRALLDYTRAGGVLCVLGDGRLPVDAEDEQPFDGGASSGYGFGRIVRIDAAELGYALTQSPWRHLAEAGSRTHQALSDRQSIVEANRVFPVLDDLAVPIRSLFVLLLVFAVVAGPVNLIVLTQKNRRIWLLWTTPAIALVFCGSVFAYSLLSEGVTPTVRLSTVTWLDQDERRATTLGWLGYYAPLAPRSGLVFDDRTELTPQFVDNRRRRGWSRTVDWAGSEQRLVSGWVTAGVPSHFRVRRVATERRRLQVEAAEGGGVVLVNHLDATIAKVHYMDGEGTIHVAEAIEPGGRATAEAVLAEVSGRGAAAARALFGSTWHGAPQLSDGHLRRLLVQQGYVAVLEDSPFVDPSLSRYHTREHPSLVIGRLDGNAAAVGAERSGVAR